MMNTKLNNKKVAITIGTFDGVHKGHLKIIETLKRDAENKGLKSVVVSFNNTPRGFITGEEVPMVLSTHDKLDLIKKEGVDQVIGLDFNEKIKAMSKREFFSYLGLDVAHIVMGHDHKFGHDRRPLHLEGITSDVVEPVYLKDQIISSTLLREFLSSGDMESMNRATGRNHFYTGEVIHGLKRGKALGFPTINLSLSDNLYTLKRGVYVSRSLVRDQWYNSVSNVGYNPTFADKSFTLETHLLDFEGSLYEEEIKVEFLHYLREEKHFEHIEDLIQQISGDVLEARHFLENPIKE